MSEKQRLNGKQSAYLDGIAGHDGRAQTGDVDYLYVIFSPPFQKCVFDSNVLLMIEK
jgi:hypothetical protein